MLASDLANSQIALGYFFVGKQTGERSSMLRKKDAGLVRKTLLSVGAEGD